MTTAFLNDSTNKLSVVVINKDYYPASLKLNYATSGALSDVTVYKTTSAMNYKNLGKVSIANNELDYTVEARSFHTFECSYSVGPDLKAPDPPENLMVSGVTNVTVSLTWDASWDNVGVTGYNVYEDGSLIDTTSDTYYTHTGLLPLTDYSYTVTAFDAAGNESGHSNVAKATTTNTNYCMACYRLDTGSGDWAYDSSGNDLHGYRMGATWYEEGRFGYCLDFDGIDDHVKFNEMDIHANELTLAAWVRPDGFVPGCDNRIISKADGSAEDSHWWMLSTAKDTSGDTVLRFRLKTQGVTSTLIASKGIVKLNEWAHAAATYDGEQMRLYLNGEEVGSMAKTGAINQNINVPCYIGMNHNAYQPWEGLIDDVYIFERALSGGEIKEIMNPAQFLSADGYEISESTGGIVNLNLTAKSMNAGRIYLMLMSATGSEPGTPMPGGMVVLPLNWDVFTNLGIRLTNTVLFQNFLGALDASGRATATFIVAPIPGAAGQSLYFAYTLFQPYNFVSNSVRIEFVP